MCGIIFFLVLFFAVAYVVASIKEAARKPPPPPFEPPPVPVPAKDDQDVATISRRCAGALIASATVARPGWAYRAALALLDAQLPVIRAQFDRLLATPPPLPATAKVNWSQYFDYRNARRRELEKMVPQLAEEFRLRLAEACQSSNPERIAETVTVIARRCRWLHQWGLDEYSYYALEDRTARLLQPRLAEHVFRQVEKLVAELRHALTEPNFTGPLLFRAEFYYPKDEEVNRPVIGVMGAPNS